MNNTQRLVFLLGIIIIALMGSCPPWKEAGPKGLPKEYAPVYSPPLATNPDKGLEIDFARLLLQIGVAAVLTGGLITATSTQEGQQEEKKEKKELADRAVNTVTQEIASQSPLAQIEPKPEIDGDTVTFNLPEGKSYGEFLVEAPDDPDSWEWYAEAAGKVRLPVNRPVQLEIVEKDDVDLSFLSLLKEDSLHSIDLTNCQLRDWELSNLGKLKGLKELDLTGSNISSQAIGYMDGLVSLEKLWLDGTGVDDQSISSLNKLSKLKKLSIRKTKISDSGLNQLKANLKECKVEA